MSPRRYLRALRKRSSRVRERTGKSIFAQVLEILRSRRLNPTLGTFDYYMFRLHDLGPQEFFRTKEFLGWRVEEQLAEALNVRVATLPGWSRSRSISMQATLVFPPRGSTRFSGRATPASEPLLRRERS